MSAPVLRLAELEIDPQQLEAYRTLLVEEISASLEREPGVLFLRAVSLRDCVWHIRIFEGYATQAAYESHLTTPHFLKYKTATAGMVKSLRLLELEPIAVS